MNCLRVGYLSSQNYLDKTAWSGVHYHMQKSLRKRENIEIIDLGEPKNPSLLRSILKRAWKKAPPARSGSSRYIEAWKNFAHKAQNKLLKTPCDLIFAPVASIELMFFETPVPIIYLTDTTFKLYYEHYYQSDLEPQEVEWNHKQELTAISKASKLIYTSDWAANSAIFDYHAKAEKIKIIPLGANIDFPPLAKDVLSKEPSLPCRLLFVGTNWHRKGGDIAFKTLITLLEMGIDTELVIVGDSPPAEIKHGKLTYISYLNKNVPHQREQLDQLFLQSHFFILPTRADCSPMVICDANAFGLPVITTEIGGIPTIVKNGENGYMLPLSASEKDYANLIAKIFSDRTGYEQLVFTSRQKYEMYLNWDKWAESMENLMVSMLDGEFKNQLSSPNLRFH